MKLMLITNKIPLIKIAEDAGVDRIFVDLEINGKKERQFSKDTHITDHVLEDVYNVKNAIKKSELIVRINPCHSNTHEEVEKCILGGADILMLPMFKTKEEVEYFVRLINGRAKTCLLLETVEALVRIDEILKVKNIDEIHIGLNDLHLSMNLEFMFELLSGGIVEYLSKKIRSYNIPFGFGGIAKVGEGDISAEYILSEHVRLESQMVILSRTFKNSTNQNEFGNEVAKIRALEASLKTFSNQKLEKNRIEFVKRVNLIAKKKYKSKCKSKCNTLCEIWEENI